MFLQMSTANDSQRVTPIVLKFTKVASHHLDFGGHALLLPPGFFLKLLRDTIYVHTVYMTEPT